MIGYIGLGLLIVAYLTMLTKKPWYFGVINFFASIALLIHALLIQDIPFIIVNAFVALILCADFFQEKTWKKIKSGKVQKNIS